MSTRSRNEMIRINLYYFNIRNYVCTNSNGTYFLIIYSIINEISQQLFAIVLWYNSTSYIYMYDERTCTVLAILSPTKTLEERCFFAMVRYGTVPYISQILVSPQ